MFTKTISRQMFLLIKRLGEYPRFSRDFYMAGGTALALQLGHRKSFDIDLFSELQFDSEEYANLLLQISKKTKIIEAKTGTLHAIVKDVKLSLFNYPYKLLKSPMKFEGLRIARVLDIACMKAIAISQRGDKKDFYDMYEILKNLPMAQLKKGVIKKFGSDKINCYHVLKSFFYFDDAELQPDPILLKNIPWKTVKHFFLNKKNEIMEEFL